MQKTVFYIVLIAVTFWGISGCMQKTEKPAEKQEVDETSVKEAQESEEETESEPELSRQENLEPVEKPSDKSKDNNLEADLAQLTQGLLAYNIPMKMMVGETYRGIVSITRSKDDSVLFEGLESNKDDFVTEDIQVSAITEVTLKDNASPKNFNIAPVHGRKELGTDDSTNTVWKWNITPLKAGNNELHLTATAKLIRFVQGSTVITYENIDIFDETITVETSVLTTVSMFFQEYWQWLITAIFIPLIGWIFNSYFKSKRKSAQKK